MVEEDYPKHYRWAIILRTAFLMYYVLKEKEQEDAVTVKNIHSQLRHHKNNLGNEAMSEDDVSECLKKFGGGSCKRKDGQICFNPFFALPIYESDFTN